MTWIISACFLLVTDFIINGWLHASHGDPYLRFDFDDRDCLPGSE